MRDLPEVPSVAWVVAEENATLHTEVFSMLEQEGFPVFPVYYADCDVSSPEEWSRRSARQVQEGTVIGGFGLGAVLACLLLEHTHARGLILGFIPREERDCRRPPLLTMGWRLWSGIGSLLGRKKVLTVRQSAARVIREAEADLALLALCGHRPVLDATSELFRVFSGRNRRLIGVSEFPGVILHSSELVRQLQYFYGLYWPQHPQAVVRNVLTLQEDVVEYFGVAFERLCEFMSDTLKGSCAVAAWGGTDYLLRLGYPARIAAGYPGIDGTYGHYWTVVALPQGDVSIDWVLDFPSAPRLQSGPEGPESLRSFDPAIPSDRERFFRDVLEWASPDDKWWKPLDAAGG